ncbi:MAG TPA: hypothetical protein VKT32_09930 [Chthonomonadaceae bacterium]|nr:hypothetical protein [Chthonomonadaceae bacterium]
MPIAATLPRWIPPLIYLLLASLFLWRSTYAGAVFLPADLLGHIAPWTAGAASGSAPPWNPLRWDGIAQFYPWRHFAAETLRAGTIPLWNPYQFCGTPFVANSQSAVFYPGNLLFWLLPSAQAFGFSALLHLTLCGWCAYLLLRRLRCGEAGALLGGIVFAYSAWEVAWLQLPTFLTTSCWFPLLLRQVHILLRRRTEDRGSLSGVTACLGAILGLILLAGHLQIAFYGLLAASLWAFGLLITGDKRALMRGSGLCLCGLLLGLLLATPQMLPSLELSRVSHRAGAPTAAGYAAYAEYALPPGGLALLTLPEIFGNDYDPGNPYWGFYIKSLPGAMMHIRHNAAETALYVGIVPLLLGLLALARGLRSKALDRRVLFFGGLALLALLLALGTRLDALFYFGIPGFGQSGSPARSLVLWALAWSALAAFGLDTLCRHAPSVRERMLTLGGFAFLFVLGLGLLAAYLSLAASLPPPSGEILSLGEALSRVGIGWARFGVALAGGIALLLPVAMRPLRSPSSPKEAFSFGALPVAVPLALLLTTADLFLAGIRVNPTASPQAVYPVTPGIAFVRSRAGHERIFPVNQKWSLYEPPPAVLPPNAAMVYGLRDVQGYDSLFPGQYKAFANQLARPNALGVRDASPPEVGNMVFFQDPNSPLAPLTAAAFALTLSPSSSAFAPAAAPPGSPLYDAENEMAVYALPHSRPRAELVPSAPTPPAWKEDSPTRITLETTTATPAQLLLADQFFPGWHAAIDGHSVPITRPWLDSVSIFRTVSVPAGHHLVSFRYEPAGFRLGLYLACFACMILTFLTGTKPFSHPGKYRV